MTSYTSTLNPSSFLLSFLDGGYNLYMTSLVLTVISLILLFLWANLFDDLTSLTVSVSRGLTLAQHRNIWNYKQCFDIKNPQAFDDPESAARISGHFKHKNVSLCGLTANWFRFMTGKILKKAKTGSKRVRVKRQYDNLSSTTSRSFSKDGFKVRWMLYIISFIIIKRKK